MFVLSRGRVGGPFGHVRRGLKLRTSGHYAQPVIRLIVIICCGPQLPTWNYMKLRIMNCNFLMPNCCNLVSNMADTGRSSGKSAAWYFLKTAVLADFFKDVKSTFAILSSREGILWGKNLFNLSGWKLFFGKGVVIKIYIFVRQHRYDDLIVVSYRFLVFGVETRCGAKENSGFCDKNRSGVCIIFLNLCSIVVKAIT